MLHYDAEAIVNIGVGEDISIADLARLIGGIVGFRGELIFDPGMPDGTPRKLVDAGRIFALGWRPRIALEEGIHSTYAWFRDNVAGTGAGAS